MCKVEGHGQLTEYGDPRVGLGKDLPEHSVHSNDEQPLCKPSQEEERPRELLQEELASINDISDDSCNDFES